MSVEPIVIRNSHERPKGLQLYCVFCGGFADRKTYIFQLPDGGFVCDGCAADSEDLSTRLRLRAAHARARADALRLEAEQLEAKAAAVAYDGVKYTTVVSPIPDDLRTFVYDEVDWPNWMREMAGLPVLSPQEHLKAVRQACEEDERRRQEAAWQRNRQELEAGAKQKAQACA